MCVKLEKGEREKIRKRVYKENIMCVKKKKRIHARNFTQCKLDKIIKINKDKVRKKKQKDERKKTKRGIKIQKQMSSEKWENKVQRNVLKKAKKKKG